MARPQAMDRPAIGQRPGQWRPRPGLRQRLDRRLGQRQGQLDPLVVSQLQQEGRIALLRAVAVLQPADELLAQLAEVRCAAAMLAHEGTHQAMPARLVEQLAQDRETAADETVQVVEEQFLVDRHALRRDAGRQGLLRIADTCGETPLQGRVVHVPYPRLRSCASPLRRCSSRMRSVSAYSSLSGGRLKSRSSSVGRSPWQA